MKSIGEWLRSEEGIEMMCMIRGGIKTVYKNMYQKYADSACRMGMPRS